MRFYLVDDDPNIVNILRIIIEDRALGEVCGSALSAPDALEDLPQLRPDVVIVDLLMPLLDGVAFVRRAKPLLPDTAFIMLSQVSSKDMIASAYESGVEFFIQKPVNSIEVENVIRHVGQSLEMRRTVSQVQSLLGVVPASAGAPAARPKEDGSAAVRQRAEGILRQLGILGEAGSRDIIALVCYLNEHQDATALSLGELCACIGDMPKTVEQRVRRAAQAGLVNLASLGVEDYGNEVFTEYAGSLYNFEQVRREMDCIRGKGAVHGKVQIRSFLTTLAFYSAAR